MAMLYALFAAGSLVLSYILRYDFAPPGEVLRQMGQQIPFFVAVQLIAMFVMGQFDSLLTFFSVPDFKRILKASLLAGLAFGSLWVFSGGELMPPRSIMVLNGILFVGLVSSLRLLCSITGIGQQFSQRYQVLMPDELVSRCRYLFWAYFWHWFVNLLILFTT